MDTNRHESLKPVETIITFQFPLKKVPGPKRDKFYRLYPRSYRWFGWLFSWGGGSCGDCDGKTNTTRHLVIFRRHVLTIRRNEYHDRSDAERADEYLRNWSECEKELRGLRLLQMGDETCAEVKKVIRESLGINLDEGTIE
jgi:hypothetical protein